MRTVEHAAIALLILGAAAASFTIWQIVGLPASASGDSPAVLELRGSAPSPLLMPEGAATLPIISPAIAEQSGPRNLAPPVLLPTTPAVAADAAGPEPDSSPVAIRIPLIEVEASVVPVGFNDRGEMASPQDFDQVGWWRFGAEPGASGRAVMAGHVDSFDGPAIFYGIDQLAPGDEIFVSNPGQPELRFVVTGSALYQVDSAPVDQIFGPSTEPELILVTCGGVFNHDTGEYLYRRVVFATLAA